MKKSLFLMFLLFTSLLVSGQNAKDDNESKWAVGVNLISFGNNVLNEGKLRYGNGVIVKRRFKPFILRAGMEYYFDTYDVNEFRGYDAVSIGGKTNEFLLKFGIEKSIVSFKFISLYGALDLFGSRYYADLDFIGGGWGFYNENQNRTIYNVGLMPTVGLEFKIMDNFSINTEFRIPFSKSFSNTRTIFFDTNISKSEKENDFGFYYDKGFVSLTANYIF